MRYSTDSSITWILDVNSRSERLRIDCRTVPCFSVCVSRITSLKLPPETATTMATVSSSANIRECGVGWRISTLTRETLAMFAPGNKARAANCRNRASLDSSRIEAATMTIRAARNHFATSVTGSKAGTWIRPIIPATFPCSKLRKTGESCSDEGSSVASSTADSRFSRSSGSLCSTCDAISSFAGRCSIRRRQVIQTTISTGKYIARLSPQRV